MICRRASLLATFAILAAALLPTGAAQAAADAPAWKLSVSSQPTNFVAGSEAEYFIFATNVGDEPTSGPVTLTDTLPEGLEPLGFGTSPCTKAGQTVTCVETAPVYPGEAIAVDIGLQVDPALKESPPLTNEVKILGGGAGAAQASTTTTISPALPSFAFLPGQEGLSGSLTDTDGTPVTQAGSHPYQFNLDLNFPSKKGNVEAAIIGADGGVRDLTTYLPRGLVGNPASTPRRCSEAQLEGEACPDDTQIGSVDGLTVPLGNVVTPVQSPLYNLVPPPGAPAAFGFNAVGVGIFIHIIAGIRPGDYAISASSKDVLSRFANPVLGARVQLWGDPSSHGHDYARGECGTNLRPPEDTCEIKEEDSPFLSFLAEPTACSQPLEMEAEADSWGHPGAIVSATAPLTDLEGNPTAVVGCNKLEFKPSIEARPTTNLIDSPSGLDVDLHQPQDFGLTGESTAHLKDAAIAFPAGLSVNAAQADGLAACSAAQIGLRSAIGASPVRFSGDPAACPDASKIGTVSVTSPLLAQYNADNKIQLDPEGNPILEPLPGSIYIAKPFENPFDSLIATYLTIEDPRSGIVIKLAGKVEPDPITGQIKTRFAENPQVPVEDVRVHLFTGARAPLQTPPTCTTHTTNANLTPWSAPQAPDAAAADSFAPTASPLGGACPATEAQLPNTHSFSAGTLSPQAGTYSPLVFKLSREDGTQRFAKIDATLPPGLSARLAGVAECSEADIAKAQSREHPNQGALEKADPSCPAASEVGVVNVGAGAGPTPFYVQGRAYLAGPYKGAPLSLAIVTPAVAGPFDLGAVVVRTALYIDPTTAQPRAVSDPLPSILDGIPVDVRSVALKMERPKFTINPTSCDPLAFSGAATSTLGQIAPLEARFQVGGCKSLPYKPKYHFRLFGPIHRGGHPRLRTVFDPKPGEANSARIVVALPRSEFIDQGHFRTICTRVQFAADQCPAGSIYGHVKAFSPLLDYPVQGPIYLRSSSHELPDVVLALRGPPAQPIEVDLVGRVDSVNGGLRTSFEAVPDAPVTKAVVTLQGGKKGLFQNSTNICKGSHRVTLKLDGQNGKTYDSSVPLKAQCGKSKKPKKKHGGKRH